MCRCVNAQMISDNLTIATCDSARLKTVLDEQKRAESKNGQTIDRKCCSGNEQIVVRSDKYSIVSPYNTSKKRTPPYICFSIGKIETNFNAIRCHHFICGSLRWIIIPSSVFCFQIKRCLSSNSTL